MIALIRRWLRSAHAKSIVDNAQSILTRLLWLLIILQIVGWLAEFWHEETYEVVKRVLWTCFALEVFIPKRIMLRRVLQSFAIVLTQINMLDMTFLPYHFGLADGWVSALQSILYTTYDNAMLFFPIIAFSVTAWLISNAIVTLTQRRAPLYMTLALIIVLLCFIDSFTFHIMWQRIALVVCCGLLLAVNQHFTEFSQKNPASWEYVKEYPGTMFSFVITIISVAMIVGMLAPNVKPVLIDPYTAWKQSRGEQVTPVGKGSSQFLSEIRWNRESGYRRDDSTLGAGFDFDYAEVMKLRTSYRSYLRGETRSVYTGKGWEKGISEQFPVYHPVDKDEPLQLDQSLSRDNLQTYDIQQFVTVVGEQQFPVLFGGYAIERVLNIEDNDVLYSFAFWSSSDAVVHWHEWDDYYPQHYQLTSQMPMLDEEGLRTTAAADIDSLTMAEYLQLPDDLPQRVIDLANEITIDETNQYDQVKALESYLETTYPYSNHPDLSKGVSADFVDRFLFEIQEGYCDYYSTAMVVMARSLGIPARWVKGYSSGVLPSHDQFIRLHQDEQYIDPNAGGEYSIRNADAHSWVEVYFDGWGWIPFEPTAGFSMPMYSYVAEGDTAVLDTLVPLDPIEDQVSEDVFGAGIPRWAYIVVAALLFIFVLYAIARRLPKFTRSKGTRRKHGQLNFKLMREFNKLFRLARKKGYEYSDHKTAREMMTAWIERNGWLKHELQRCLHYFELVKYSGQTITAEQYEEAMQLLKKMRVEMK